MLIDTHCHLDALEFDVDRDQIALASHQAGVSAIVVPAVARINFDQVTALSQTYSFCYHALGWHPMYIDAAQPSDIRILRQTVAQQIQQNAKLVAIGEIGLDFFVTDKNRETQEYFFSEQLKIAQEFDLPVILHVRRAVDDVLKHLRRQKVKGGIAHAFNGSFQQAETFIKLGFKLGFGGAMTYARALHLRKLAQTLPLSSIVLETDAPDIPPAWIGNKGRNTPFELGKIAEILAEIREMNSTQVLEITSKNAIDALPKLAQLFTSL